jgi:hypothetical protein
MAFAHIDLVGFHRGDWRRNTYGGPHTVQNVTHGWPNPFAIHEERCTVSTGWPQELKRPPFFNQVDPRNWLSFHITSAGVLSYDIFFQVCLVVVTGVAIVRLAGRLRSGCVLSAVDKLIFLVVLLVAACALFAESPVLIAIICTPLRDLPLFDALFVSLTIACAAGLALSLVRRCLAHRRIETSRLVQRLSRTPVFAILACLLVAAAFVDIDVLGFSPNPGAEDTYVSLDGSEFGFYHGWPAAFARHVQHNRDATPLYGEGRIQYPSPSFLDRINPTKWEMLRLESVRAAVFDLFLHAVLIAVVGVMVFRLERRRWLPFQFSISDLLSLTATASMVLGLICLDRIPFLVHEGYLQLQSLPLLDGVMILFAIACAVALIVSTVIGRLATKQTDADRASQDR